MNSVEDEASEHAVESRALLPVRYELEEGHAAEGAPSTSPSSFASHLVTSSAKGRTPGISHKIAPNWNLSVARSPSCATRA